MPLRIAMTCDTLCHSGICQSGERRMSTPSYTVASGIQMKTLNAVNSPVTGTSFLLINSYK